jgi:hypothetical protein
LAGAGIGAAIGEDGGDALPAALLGGAIGALGGAAVGGAIDDEEMRRQAYWQARQQQMAQAVTFADVVSMTRAGLGDEVIVNQIQTRGLAQPVTTNDLIMLKQQGISDRVMYAMQRTPGIPDRPLLVRPAPVVIEEYYYPRPYWAPVYHRHYHHGHHGHSGFYFHIGH